jgi:SAM-dependent methyltransferase
LKHLYDDDYIRELPGGEGLETDSAWVLDPLSWEAARMQYATAGVRGRRLLEIGCATGQFLAPLKQQGWEVWGVEFNLQAAAAAARRLSATVLGGEFMSANLPQEYFDTVTLFHVIEHVLDPRKTVEKIRSVLRKNGRLVLETPDIGSRRARKLGPNWPSVKPGEHLYYFDQNSLHNLLEGAGFRVDKVRRCGGLGMLTPAQRPGGTHALKHMTFGVRRWLAPTPWLRGLARRLYWDFLRQNDCILVVASRRS